MAEDFDPARLSADKRARYAELALEVASVLEGEGDRVARMATVASMLHHAFDTISGPASMWSIRTRVMS